MFIRTLPFLLTIATSLAINTAQATTNGALNFRGQVNAGTCNLAAGDENRTVTLPTIKISDFDSNGWTAGNFDFEVSADCESDISNVIFLFAGTPSAGTPALFSNTGSSGGTALVLSHRATTNTVIPANGSLAQRSKTAVTSNKKAVLPLSAAYHKSGGAITQGTLVSAVTVSITYN